LERAIPYSKNVFNGMENVRENKEQIVHVKIFDNPRIYSGVCQRLVSKPQISHPKQKKQSLVFLAIS
ncbi:MAG: hypothetical protein KAQ62_21730, partial [Cyclobacteriaceae bacterium]|nr:hypothetical protein [Cyclobacteriaceae bacterium]